MELSAATMFATMEALFLDAVTSAMQEGSPHAVEMGNAVKKYFYETTASLNEGKVKWYHNKLVEYSLVVWSSLLMVKVLLGEEDDEKLDMPFLSKLYDEWFPNLIESLDFGATRSDMNDESAEKLRGFIEVLKKGCFSFVAYHLATS